MRDNTKRLHRSATQLRQVATGLHTNVQLHTVASEVKEETLPSQEAPLLNLAATELNTVTELSATREVKEEVLPSEANKDLLAGLPNEANKNLLQAVEKGDIEKFISCVSTYNINPHLVELKTGNNAAHYAAFYNQVRIFAYIKASPVLPGFIPNKVNNDGDTYLHLAAANGHLEMVKYLTDIDNAHCIDISIQNCHGDTAEEVARNNEHYVIADHLALLARAAEEKEQDGAKKTSLSAQRPQIPQAPQNQIIITREIQADNPSKGSARNKFTTFVQKLRNKNVRQITQPGQKQPKYVSKIWDDLSFTPNTIEELQNILLLRPQKAKYTSLNLSNLRKLGSNEENEAVKEADLQQIIEQFPRLTSLEFGNHLMVSEAGLNIIVNNMRNLTALGLVNHNLPVGIIANNLPNLTSLRFPAGYYKKTIDIDNGELSNDDAYEGVTAVISRSKRDILQITKLRNLTFLDIGFYHTITDAEIALITIELQKLTSLNLSYCLSIGNAAMTSIATNLPGLTSLNLSYCYGVTENGIKTISTMHSLTSLNLRDCGVKMTKAGISSIANNMPQLEKLTLGEVRYNILDKAFFKKIANNMPKLTYLDVSGYRLVNDDILKIIAKKMPGLTCLNLSNCPDITNGAIKHLANMHNLRHLDCNMRAFLERGKIPGITNDALLELKRSLTETKIIGIDGKEISLRRHTNPELRHVTFAQRERINPEQRRPTYAELARASPQQRRALYEGYSSDDDVCRIM